MELENQKQAQADASKQQTDMMQLMQNSMQQMQQFTATVVQSQNTQNQALLTLLEKLAKK